MAPPAAAAAAAAADCGVVLACPLFRTRERERERERERDRECVHVPRILLVYVVIYKCKTLSTSWLISLFLFLKFLR